MLRWLLAATVLAVASGCESVDFSNKKEDAQKRWFNARSRVLYRLAQNRFSAGQLDKAAESVKQALVLQAEFPEAELLMAKIQIEQGRYSLAVKRLTAFEKDHPNSSELAYLLGAAQEKGGMLEEALASYRRAYALDESNLSAVKAAAEVLVEMGHVRRARTQIDSYLPKAGEDAGMYELAGRLAAMTGDHSQAVEHYQRACDLDAQNHRYLEMLGRSQYRAERYAEAVDTLTELMARRDHKAETWAFLMLGDSYLALGKAHKAFDAYFSASEQTPDEPGIWVALARAALAMGDAERSVLSARTALRLAPAHVDAALLLGYALLRKGESAEAVGTLKAAAIAHPDNATVRCLLGRAHAAAGNEADAIRSYTEALRIDPGNVVARHLLSAAGGRELSKAD